MHGFSVQKTSQEQSSDWNMQIEQHQNQMRLRSWEAIRTAHTSRDKAYLVTSGDDICLYLISWMDSLQWTVNDGAADRMLDSFALVALGQMQPYQGLG